MDKKNTYQQRAIEIIGMIAIFIAINFIAGEIYTRIDLTKEKRHSLTDASEQMIQDINDIIYIKVYLEGDFPAGFKRLSKAAEDVLEEFQSYNPHYLEFEFINPFDGISDPKEIQNIMVQLAGKGLKPTNIKSMGSASSEQTYIFPSALITYQGNEIPVNFLHSQLGISPAEALNNSVSGLEYSFISGIRKAMTVKKPKVGMITGHGEIADQFIYDFVNSLEAFYQVERIEMNDSLLFIPNSFKTIVIAKPTERFSEQDKFIIDQYAMNGGAILWLVDPIIAAMDSLQGREGFPIIPMDLNIDDQLFQYGARLNKNLIQDVQCAPHPFSTGFMGNVPQFELFEWLYFPIALPSSSHPIVNNMDAILLQFASSIDTVGNSNIKKTPLLTSSKYARSVFTGARVSHNIVKNKPAPGMFNQPNLTTALLMEGPIESLYKSRSNGKFVKAVKQSTGIDFKTASIGSKMIVVADGDIIKNGFDRQGNIYPCGFYKYTGDQFSNKKFLMNCVEYLCGINILEANSKTVTLRPLDTKRIEKTKNYWKLLNLILPIAMILIFRVIFIYVRYRKYKSNE